MIGRRRQVAYVFVSVCVLLTLLIYPALHLRTNRSTGVRVPIETPIAPTTRQISVINVNPRTPSAPRMRRPTEHTVERVIRTYPTLATPSGERRNGTGMEDQGAPRVGLAADPQKLACPVLGAVNTTRQQTSLCSPVLGTTRGIHNTPTFLTLFTSTRFNRAEHNITLSVLRLWPLLGKDVKVRSNRIQVLALDYIDYSYSYRPVARY